MRQMLRSAVMILVLLPGLATLLHAGVVTFNFDADTAGTTTSFTDTINGLSATFSSPSDVPNGKGAFIVLPSGGFFPLPLSGNVLSQNTTPVASLTIGFSAPQAIISLDFLDADITNPVNLSAYLGGTGGTLAGTSSQTGSGSLFALGTLGFSTSTFDTVVLTTASGSLAIDNIMVNDGVASASAVPEPGSLLLCAGALATLALVRLRRPRAC